jgi:hypothetical protein
MLAKTVKLPSSFTRYGGFAAATHSLFSCSRTRQFVKEPASRRFDLKIDG